MLTVRASHTPTLTVDMQEGAVGVYRGLQGAVVEETLVQPCVVQTDLPQDECVTHDPCCRQVPPIHRHTVVSPVHSPKDAFDHVGAGGPGGVHGSPCD